ncbi:Coq4 family protein [Nannocystis pusilla]|uniref:Coq4 family protein n=1 Tax=Nannocystis pusilla TaxID=889268 RepID=UPI003B7C69AE
MPRPDPRMQLALQALALFPRFTRWAATRVQGGELGRGLSLRQFAVFAALRAGNRSPSEVAARLNVTPAVVTGLVDRLERRGYVRREVSPGDRRRYSLRITEAGERVCDEVQQALADQLAAQFAGASAEALAECSRALIRIEQAVAALERTPALAPTREPPARQTPAKPARPRRSPAREARVAPAKPARRSPAPQAPPPRSLLAARPHRRPRPRGACRSAPFLGARPGPQADPEESLMNTTATVPPTASSFDLPEDASLPRRIGLALRALRTLRDDPKDIAAGKALNLSLNRDALARLREELARTEDGRRLLAERPPLDGRVLDLAALERLPEGTLGREFARYFGANGITPFENPYPVHSDVEYLSRRYRDEHDLVHVLTGYGTDVPGEVELQAFIVGNLGLGPRP